MKLRLSNKMVREDFQKSFSQMMLEVISNPNIISFAGGMPNPSAFPYKELENAADIVLEHHSKMALQYSITEGHEPLRNFIANRYKRHGIDANANDIIITNGAQQAIDILCAAMLNTKDDILTEGPTFLAALQVFHLHYAKIHTIEVDENGIDLKKFKNIIEKYNPKLFYAIPNFQNPTGLTYDNKTREKVSNIITTSDTILMEDDPYGDLRFRGENQKSFYHFLKDQCVLFGTFSKTISPGIRVGWAFTKNKKIMEKMIEYKQIVDVHTSMLDQMILYEYLKNNDFDAHIEKIKKLYSHQLNVMLSSMEKYFPKDVKYTKPEGGMFVWATLPEGMRAINLSEKASKAGVAITAGDAFYEKKRNVRTFRLNYTNCNYKSIEKGISILGNLIKKCEKSI